MDLGRGTRTRQIRDGISHTLAASEVLGYDSESDKPDRILIYDKTIPKDHTLYRKKAYNANLWATARSSHPGGVVASTCDGAIRFVSNDIELSMWQALAIRAGGDSADMSTDTDHGDLARRKRDQRFGRLATTQ